MIQLKKLINEAGNFTAKSKESGKLVHFKSKDSYEKAIKAGSHEDPANTSNGGDKKSGVNIFNTPTKSNPNPSNKPTKPKKSKPFNADKDEADFENALEGDGFSSYDGGSLEGVSTFGDENGNTVAVAAGSVYDSKSAFVVSGFNDDDPADVESKEFDSKAEAMAYAKKLGQKLKKQNPNQKYAPNSDEPESKGGLPSDEDTYKWSTGKMKMPVDKNLLKSVNKLSTTLKLNQKGSFSDIPKAEYERKMLSLVHDALEDANFHGANRQIFADLQGKPELAKRPDYSKAPKMGTPERDEWDMKNSIYNKNFDGMVTSMDGTQDAISDINSQSGWDGEKTLAALLAKMRNDGAGVLADKIQTSFEKAMANNEAKLKLGDLL